MNSPGALSTNVAPRKPATGAQFPPSVLPPLPPPCPTHLQTSAVPSTTILMSTLSNPPLLRHPQPHSATGQTPPADNLSMPMLTLSTPTPTPRTPMPTNTSTTSSSTRPLRGSTWGQPGVNLRSTWGQPGVNLGSTWGQPGVNLGSTSGQPRVTLGSTWGQPAPP